MSDSVFSRMPVPLASQLLGWALVSEDPQSGCIEVAFNPDHRMLNPHGTVQGGFVAAMLDDTMGPALFSMTGGKVIASSIDLNVSFIRPVKPGRRHSGRRVRLMRVTTGSKARFASRG